MAHVKPFIIVGIDVNGDVGIAVWGQGESEEDARLQEMHNLYPEETHLTVIYLAGERDLRSLRRLQAEGARRNDEGIAGKGWDNEPE
jgi:hypothetical protein